MVLTNNQTLAFFTEDTQMAIPAATVAQLATEGIVTVDDLAEFDSEGLKTIVDNLRRPPGTLKKQRVRPATPVLSNLSPVKRMEEVHSWL